MVLRMTGAGWLAAMMRVEREEGEAFDDAWLLFGPSDPAVVERRASENDPG
ncbi:hypothetical protein, partial [Caulobacter vibrioides]